MTAVKVRLQPREKWKNGGGMKDTVVVGGSLFGYHMFKNSYAF